MAGEHPVLETRGLTIRFGGHVAVNAVSCRFEPGSLTAIVGPNGAGKTTYFNLVSGQLRASAGQVLLYGEDVTRDAAPVRTRKGMGRAFQLTNLFPGLTVLENVRLAVQARAGLGLNLVSMWASHVELTEKAEHFLERVALAGRQATPASELSHG
ncbi:MAG TPA: ATP-binding cassette domain-containing protein, partial [Burkholderiales bacterium]|nr:ATP-binding cassette domain-containing protein [Burkholderiales bacterium]